MTNTKIDKEDLERLNFLSKTVGRRTELVLFRHYIYKKYSIDWKTQYIDISTGIVRSRDRRRRDWKLVVTDNPIKK